MAVTAPTVTGTPQAFNFTTSGTTVTYTGGGTANATTFDVVLVNSDNVVTTPAGWSLVASAVTNQGSYIFAKSGGTTSASFALGGGVASNTGVLWVRITNATAVDQTATAQANASAGSSTPAATTATLAAATELVLSLAALHSFNTGTPTAGAWSTGYTELITTSSLSGANTTYTYSSAGVKVPAGTAAESPSYSWTNPTFERYTLVATFTGFDAGSGGTAPTGIAATVALGSPSASNPESATPGGIATAVALGSPSVSLNRSAAPTGIAVTLALGTPSASLALTTTPSGVGASTSLGQPNVSSTPGPNGVAVSVLLGAPTVSLNRSAAPSGIPSGVLLGAPSIVSVITPSGVLASVSLGSPSVSATVLTAGTPGSWYGLRVTDELNRQYAREEKGAPTSCPNDGESLQRNPRTGQLQCNYDSYVYTGW